MALSSCTQYCLVRKNPWFWAAWLIDGVPSFPRPIVAGSLFDSSNISFASTRHSAMGSHFTQYAIKPILPALRGEWRQPRAFCAEELARHEYCLLYTSPSPRD